MNPLNYQKEKKIWELLVEEGLITPELLEAGLSKQVELAVKGYEVRIWEILVAGNVIPNRRVMINFLWKSRIPLRILEVLFLRGDITEDQYKSVQKMILENKRQKTHKTVGEIILELGYMDETTFFNILSSSGIPLNVWEKLVQKGIISFATLKLAMQEQHLNPKHQGKNILDVLYEEKLIQPEIYIQFKPLEIETIEFKF